MKIYREVLIESTEQAEALPEGTIAHVHIQVGARLESRWGTFVKELDGRWSAGGFSQDYFTGADMIEAEALVPISVEDLIRKTAASVLAEQARRAEEADRKRREFDAEVRRRAEEQYMGDAFRRVDGFSTPDRAS